MQNQFLRKCFRCINYPVVMTTSTKHNGDAILTLSQLISLQFTNTCFRAIHYLIHDDYFHKVFEEVFCVCIIELVFLRFVATDKNRVWNFLRVKLALDTEQYVRKYKPLRFCTIIASQFWWKPFLWLTIYKSCI